MQSLATIKTQNDNAALQWAAKRIASLTIENAELSLKVAALEAELKGYQQEEIHDR
jgi:hypothetical protein